MKIITTTKKSKTQTETINNHPPIPEIGGGFEKKRHFGALIVSVRIVLCITQKGWFCQATTGRVRGFNLYKFQSGFI